MKTPEQLEVLAAESVATDNYLEEMTPDEQYHHRRGFIFGYQKAERMKFDFMSNVIERISLSIKIEWLHLVFRFKYPEATTEPIKWLSNYNEYLRKCHKIREKMNAL
jgi:hypothetical protein